MATDERKILVVDDEPDVATYLEMVLQDAGYTTVTAENGREGFAKAQAEQPDLICLDVTMPEESGIRCYRNLREDEALKNTPVVLVTAVTGYGGDPEPFKNFMSTRDQVPPPDGFFSKPIDREAFVTKIKELLA
ncbi:MAG: response regulator [bacterium]|nr:response regulator [bacterium]